MGYSLFVPVDTTFVPLHVDASRPACHMEMTNTLEFLSLTIQCGKYKLSGSRCADLDVHAFTTRHMEA